MGIVRDYLKYEKGPLLNIISGPKGNIIFADKGSSCITTSSEDVVYYNLKTQERNKLYYGEQKEVSCITYNYVNFNIAAGYIDGSIQLFNQSEAEPILTFFGHKSSVTSLDFDLVGHKLASGSQDTTLVVWDIISESGLFKLKGHKGNVTSCKFLKIEFISEILISSAKDGTIKFWDLNLQHCFKTIFENGNDINDFLVIKEIPDNLEDKYGEENNDNKLFRLIFLTSDNYLHLWSMKVKNTNNLCPKYEEFTNFNNESVQENNIKNTSDVTHISLLDSLVESKYLGKLARNTKFVGTHLVKDQHDTFIGCHGNDKILNIYQITNAHKLHKIYKKKIKTRRTQLNTLPNNTEDNCDISEFRTIEDEIAPFEECDRLVLKDCKIKSCDFFTCARLDLPGNRLFRGRDRHLSANLVMPSERENENVQVGPIDITDISCSKKRERKKIRKSFKKYEEHKSSTNKILKICVMQSDNKISVYESFQARNAERLELKSIGDNENEIDTPNNFDVTGYWLRSCFIENNGHGTDVRTLSISTDSNSILSASAESVKIWNRLTQKCTRTMPCEYGLCSLFLPADKYAIVGSKTGKLHLYDVQTGDLVENLDAHDGPVWAIALHPNQESIITGGGSDHTVKFWDLQLVTMPEHVNMDEGELPMVSQVRGFPSYDSSNPIEICKPLKRLAFNHTKTLHLEEDILCLKPSSDHKFLAIGLLDNTVKLFFLDTLKFYLSLYGHSMPVTCMDISQDSSLIVTGSNDKLIKIWGTKFGDCHKTLRGHSDTITCLNFVPHSINFGHDFPISHDHETEDSEVLQRDLNLFFSAGKDGLIIQWDAIKFEKIFLLKGHHAEIWAMACSSLFLVTASHDKTIRIWYKTDEIVNPKDEADKEAQEVSEKSALENMPSNVALNYDPKTGEFSTKGRFESSLASTRSLETLDATEKLIQALDLYLKHIESTLANKNKSGDQTSNSLPVHISADALSDPSGDEDETNGLNLNCEGHLDDEGFEDGKSKVPTLREILADKVADPSSEVLVKTDGSNNVEKYIIDSYLRNIKFSELQYATLLLPRAYVDTLTNLLYRFLAKHIQTSHPGEPINRESLVEGHSLEVCVKLMCFLLKTQANLHIGNVGSSSAFSQSSRELVSSSIPHNFIQYINELRDKLVPIVLNYRDVLGFNKTVLGYLHKRLFHDEELVIQQGVTVNTNKFGSLNFNKSTKNISRKNKPKRKKQKK